VSRTSASGEAKRWPLLELGGAVVVLAWRVVVGVVLVERATEATSQTTKLHRQTVVATYWNWTKWWWWRRWSTRSWSSR
jgi:hypothetical protein